MTKFCMMLDVLSFISHGEFIMEYLHGVLSFFLLQEWLMA